MYYAWCLGCFAQGPHDDIRREAQEKWDHLVTREEYMLEESRYNGTDSEYENRTFWDPESCDTYQMLVKADLPPQPNQWTGLEQVEPMRKIRICPETDTDL